MSRGYVYLATPVNNKGEYLLDYYTSYPYDLRKGLHKRAEKYGCELQLLAYQMCFETAKVRKYLWSKYCNAEQPMSHPFHMDGEQVKDLIRIMNTDILDSYVVGGFTSTSVSMDDLVLESAVGNRSADMRVSVGDALLERLKFHKTRIISGAVDLTLMGFTDVEILLRINYLSQALSEFRNLDSYITNSLLQASPTKTSLKKTIYPLDVTDEAFEASKPFTKKILDINRGRLIAIISQLRFDDKCPFLSEDAINTLQDRIFECKR